MIYEFPAPQVFAMTDEAEVMAIDIPKKEFHGPVWDRNRRTDSESAASFQAFGQLPEDLKTALNSDETFRLAKVEVFPGGAQPGQPFMIISDARHADAAPTGRVNGVRTHKVILQTAQPTLYTCGIYDNPDFFTHQRGPVAGQLAVGDINRIGCELDQIPEGELQNRYPGLYMQQPLAFAAHLLTSQHLHESPQNMTDYYMPRRHYELLIESFEPSKAFTHRYL